MRFSNQYGYEIEKVAQLVTLIGAECVERKLEVKVEIDKIVTRIDNIKKVDC